MALEQAYLAYTKGGPDMDGRTFVKILKDSKLFDSKFTQVDADLIFAGVKAKGAKKITYGDFEAAMEKVAAKKGDTVASLTAKIGKEGAEGPILYGTRTDSVRFHDDKSTYTGVHKQGGPTTVDAGRVQFNDLSEICDRSSVDIRGVNKSVMGRKSGDNK